MHAEAKLPFNIGKRNQRRSRSLLFGALLLVACEERGRTAQLGQRLVMADVILTVINTSQRSIKVSLESDTREQVLGDVERNASRSFSLPSELVESPSMLRLSALRDDAPPVRSDTFQVRHGQKVVWALSDTGRGTVVRH